jgi:three-Cys-motif partner protein
MTLSDSQTSMYQHSEIKVRLLKLYLERYLNILNGSQFVGDIYLYDLFCSEGIYDNGGKGSPIIFLETVKDIHFSNVAKNRNSGLFHCYFNDLDRSKIDKLEKNIFERKLHYSQMGKLIFSKNDYRSLIPEISTQINTFRDQKAFIFIDPYGYKDIRISDIKLLLQSKKSEVLLFLPTQFMFRFESKGTPESLKEFISELVPESEWPTSATGIDFIENLKCKFREQLGNDFFVDSFIITRDKNQFFCLFFFTSHIYGFDRMLDAKWEIDEEEGRGWKYPVTSNLFSDVEKSPNTYLLEIGFASFLKDVFRTNGEIYEFILHSGFLPSHANNILDKLQNEGKLEIKTKTGGKPRKGAYYLSYKNWRNENDKILLKIK